MARKNQAASADEILKQMYPDLLDSTDYEAQEAKKAEAAKTPAGPSIEDLQRQIAVLEGRVQVTSRPVTPIARVSVAPQRPIIDESKAPDPITDPQGYARWTRAAVAADIQYEKELFAFQNQQQQASAGKVSQLWDDFKNNYTDYAKRSDQVEIAAERVIRKAAAAGVDTDAYMYQQSDNFLKDVVKEVDKLFGKPKAGDDDTGDDDDDDTDDNRTAVLSGSSAGRGGPSAARPAPQKYGELSTEIMAWQEKTGFHR